MAYVVIFFNILYIILDLVYVKFLFNFIYRKYREVDGVVSNGHELIIKIMQH